MLLREGCRGGAFRRLRFPLAHPSDRVLTRRTPSTRFHASPVEGAARRKTHQRCHGSLRAYRRGGRALEGKWSLPKVNMPHSRESDTPGTDRPRKIQNQVGRAGHLFEGATVAPGHPRELATICRQSSRRTKDFTLLSGKGPRQMEKPPTPLCCYGKPRLRRRTWIRLILLLTGRPSTRRTVWHCPVRRDLQEPSYGRGLCPRYDPVTPQKETARRALFCSRVVRHSWSSRCADRFLLWCNEGKTQEATKCDNAIHGSFVRAVVQ